MPAENLFKRMKERPATACCRWTGVNPPECNPNVAPAKAAWKKAGIKPRITDFSMIELENP